MSLSHSGLTTPQLLRFISLTMCDSLYLCPLQKEVSLVKVESSVNLWL